jgi:hypothetical protein
MPPYFCKPSENVAPNATWAVTVGGANPLYPVTNVYNLDPANPTKSTGLTYTIRATFAGAQTIKVVQFLMHNLAGTSIAITNNGGLSTTLTPAANYGDGFPEFSWKDLRDNANNSATIWTFAMTVASGIVQLGEIVLWEDATLFPLKWELSHGPNRLAHRNVTDWGYEHYYDRGIRERTIDGDILGTYWELLLELEADAHGCVKQFPVILEDDTQESYWVRFTKDSLAIQRLAPLAAKIRVELQETGLGLAP